ncbi:MAG: InlB B-repeat-containing protein [Eubacteriales bacterium]|nr:InlB B-repeat-containing protein [Eubacteriales bacterium]
MSSMFGTVGTYNPEYLLSGPEGAQAIAIPCEPGNGTLARGQIMYRKSSGMYAPAGTGQMSASYNLVVLDEAVDTNASLTIAEDARAYRAGRMIRGKLILASGATLTAAHALVLRQQGIVLDVMDDADATFDNYRVTVTYKANGGTGADVVVYADAGSTYAIAANTFTPPSGKTFSKWNTKADGTGTDYAAAASYTASAALTLYAIWATT